MGIANVKKMDPTEDVIMPRRSEESVSLRKNMHETK
jgi:hypothetical protein